jgi:hypothetical protein
MADAAVGIPKVFELTVVPKPVITGWLSALLVESRNCSVRRLSPKRKDRLICAFKDVWNGPGMVPLPAFPHWPAAGVVKAAVLK